MERTSVRDLFIAILRSELTETELDPLIQQQITPEIVRSLYILSKRHDLAHIISSALYKYNLHIGSELLAKFDKEEMVAIYRNEQIKYAYTQICEILEEAKIPYVPLKGAVLRAYYPEDYMRTSCDIDILIQEQNLKPAVDILIRNNYTCEKRNYHDVSLFSPEQVHLELHFSIKENMPKLDTVLKNAWNYASLVKGSCYKFSNEFFAYHMIAHVSYHFLAGGCGIRSLMDIWVMTHKMGITYSSAKELLEKGGIYQFAIKISNLSEICFSGKSSDEFSDMLLDYIFCGGVYGSLENKVAVKKTEIKRGIGYVVNRLFLPYNAMKNIFPVLKKFPVLLPFCWGIRFFKMVFGGKIKKSVLELQVVNSMKAGQIETIQMMKEQLGL